MPTPIIFDIIDIKQMSMRAWFVVFRKAYVLL